jgi:hypothetical protein
MKDCYYDLGLHFILLDDPSQSYILKLRDRALRANSRRELAGLTFDHLQQREDHWAVVDLIGKTGHI